MPTFGSGRSTFPFRGVPVAAAGLPSAPPPADNAGAGAFFDDNEFRFCDGTTWNILADRAWVQSQTFQVVAAGYTINVGTGGTFEDGVRHPTINSALAWLSQYKAKYDATNVFVNVNLEAGYTVAEQVILNGDDFSWVRLYSTNWVVPVDGTALTVGDEDRSHSLFRVGPTAVLPSIVGMRFEITGTPAQDPAIVAIIGAYTPVTTGIRAQGRAQTGPATVTALGVPLTNRRPTEFHGFGNGVAVLPTGEANLNFTGLYNSTGEGLVVRGFASLQNCRSVGSGSLGAIRAIGGGRILTGGSPYGGSVYPDGAGGFLPGHEYRRTTGVNSAQDIVVNGSGAEVVLAGADFIGGLSQLANVRTSQGLISSTAGTSFLTVTPVMTAGALLDATTHAGMLGVVSDGKNGAPCQAYAFGGAWFSASTDWPVTSQVDLKTTLAANSRFRSDLYFVAGSSVAFGTAHAFARSTVAENLTGAVLGTQSAIDALRRDSTGALVEPGSVVWGNAALSSAVAGSPGTMPAFWAMNTPSGLTRTLELATADGVSYLDITLAGTTSSTTTMNMSGAVTTVPALNAQTWTSSAIMQVLTDDPAITALSVRNEFQNSGGTQVQSGEASFYSTRTQRLRRSGTLTATSADTAFARPRIFITNTIPSGTTINWKIRVGLPNLAQGQLQSPVIGSGTGSTTRGADLLSQAVTGMSTAGFVALSAAGINATATVGAVALTIDDGTDNNRIELVRTAAGSLSLRSTVAGTVVSTLTVAVASTTWAAAATWGGGTADLAINGVAVTGAFTIPPGLTTLRLGSRTGAANTIQRFEGLFHKAERRTLNEVIGISQASKTAFGGLT